MLGISTGKCFQKLDMKCMLNTCEGTKVTFRNLLKIHSDPSVDRTELSVETYAKHNKI